MMPTDQPTEGLRVRRCFDPTCNTLFTICASCDRGQRYCSDVCRKRMRQQQMRASGRQRRLNIPQFPPVENSPLRRLKNPQAQKDCKHAPAQQASAWNVPGRNQHYFVSLISSLVGDRPAAGDPSTSFPVGRPCSACASNNPLLPTVRRLLPPVRRSNSGW